MTCIVAVKNGNTVVVGGDSLGIAGTSIVVRKDPKVFRLGDLVIGYTSSFRMGQILRYEMEPLTAPKRGLDRWMVTHFLPLVRDKLKDGGYARIDSNVESGGCFIVGVRNRAFVVESDFQVGEPACDYTAVGCGEDLALGAMHATSSLSAKARARAGLSAAADHNAGVAPPFKLMETRP